MRYCFVIRNSAVVLSDDFIRKTMRSFGIQVLEIKEANIEVDWDNRRHHSELKGREVWFNSDMQRDALHETLKRILCLNEAAIQSFLIHIKDN